MIIIKNKIIPFGSFVAMTIGPFIFTKKDYLSPTVINHESIHWEQYKELLILFFIPLYCLMYLWELLRCLFNPARGTRADGKHRSIWKRAYYCIALEREAYANECDEDYIENRKPYAWARHKE
jgi:hypothetical protein